MSLLLHIMFIFLYFVISGTSGQPCYLTTKCTDFKIYTSVDNSDSARREMFRIENETEIASNGHFHGLVPNHYRIDFNFLNMATFEGSVDITFKTVRAISRIAISSVPSSVLVDYTLVNIRSVCTENAGMVMNGCIENVTIVREDEVIVLDVKGAELETGMEWILSFPYLRSLAGLSGQEIPEEDLSTKLLHVRFNLRDARHLLPCFDHPALKARFELCLERPFGVGVVSNTPIDPGQSKVIGVDRLRDCFQVTPPISISSFAFSLFVSPPYIMESVELIDDGPIIQVITDQKAMDNVRRDLNEILTRFPYFRYLDDLTGFKYPLKKLTFLTSHSEPNLASNNLGLIYLDSQVFIFRSLITQWIGNIVTVSEWRESCLQNGLELFFAAQFIASGSNRSMQDVIKEAVTVFSSEYHPPLATNHFNHLNDIDKACSFRATYCFYTLSQFYDPSLYGTVTQFTRRLFKKKAWQTASIREWDGILDEMLKNEEHPMKGYFQGWFLQPGQLYLLASRVSSDCIIIRQKVLGPYAPSQQVPRPVPVKIHVFGDSPQSIKIVLKSVRERICDIDGEFLINPEGAPLVRTAYSVNNYQDLLAQMKRNPALLNLTQKACIFLDFCLSLIMDQFPLPDDTTGSMATWLELFQHLRNSETNFGPLHDLCHCCLSIGKGNCHDKDKEHCDKLRLNQVLIKLSEHEEL